LIQLPVGWFPKNFYYDVEDSDVNDFYSTFSEKSPIKTKSSMFNGLRQWDIFRYSLALGVYYEKELDFKRKSANIPTDHLRDQDIVSIFATVFSSKDNNLELLQEPKKIQTICENIANFGVRKLMEINSQVEMANPIAEYESQLNKLINEK
jgi:hypothetical protein